MRTLGLVALILVLGVAAAALALLPAYEMAGHTGRAVLSYDEATRYSLPPKALIGLLAPGFFGRGPAGFWGGWERVEVGYAGVATLVLAGIAVSRQRLAASREQLVSHVSRFTFHVSRFTFHVSRFPTGFFALLVPLALLLAMGRYTPLYALLYRCVPGFEQVRVPARFILLADFGLAALAAHGLDQLLGPLSERFRRPLGRVGWGAFGLAGMVLAVGLPLARAVPPADRVAQASGSVLVAALLMVLSGLLVVARARRRRSPRWMGWAVVLLVAADLSALGSTVEAEPNDPTAGFRHPQVVAFLRDDPDLFRIESTAGAWQPDAALVHGLFDIGGVYNPLGLAPYQAYCWAVGERGGPLYNLLNVKYVLADKARAPGGAALVPVFTDDPEMNVYLNRAALPRALLVHCPQVVPDHTAAWEAIHAPEFDPTRTVVLEAEQIADCRLQVPDPSSHVSFVDYGLNEIELAVRTPVSGYLVLSEVYYPGWRAEVDGVPAEVLRADYIFRAVYLGPGEHRVRLWFDPWTWKLGLAVSVVTWVGLAVWGGIALRRRCRRAGR